MQAYSSRANIFAKYHFWVLAGILLLLTFMYWAWPWRGNQGGWTGTSWSFWLRDLATWEVGHRIIGSLFLVAIVYGAAVFSWRGALIVWLLSVAAITPLLWPYGWQFLIINLSQLALPSSVVSFLFFQFEWRGKLKRMVAEQETERQTYVSRLQETQEEERHRIARELHDETIQTLLAVANRVDLLALCDDTTQHGKLTGDLVWVRDKIVDAAEDLRRISLDLRPGLLDDAGLVPALRWLVDRMNADHHILTDIQILGTERKLPPKIETAIFRIVQEALSNVHRHSKAKLAVTTLEFDKTSLRISVRDNGQGFQLPASMGSLAVRGKLGLAGMQQRVGSLGGDLRILSKPGEGTSVIVEVTA